MDANLTFDPKQLNDQSGGDAGTAFQEFTADVLAIEFGRRLHRYSAHGKDGGVDCTISGDGGRAVVECKYIGPNGERPLVRWRNTSGKHLAKHLGSSKPSKQYRPWFSKSLPVKRYLYCFSVPLKNDAERDEIREAMEAFYGNLAQKPGLEHLADLEVEIWSWGDLRAMAERNQQLLCWWFPNKAPGFTALHQPRQPAPISRSTKRPFRDYLNQAVMPYYSRERFQAGQSNPVLQDEERLLDRLEQDRLLIITGRGGVGKSRLTLELGRLAQARRGWWVFKGSPSLRVSHFEQLVVGMDPEARVLVLVDYVETQRAFTTVAEWVEDFAETNRGVQLYLAANCREHYFGQLGRYSRYKVDLDQKAVAYQKAAVRHILHHAWDAAPPPELVEECADAPILAVFASYLKATGRGDQLRCLLESPNQGFLGWLHKRVEMSFGEPRIPDRLGEMAALFPLSSEGLDALVEDDDYEKLYQILVDDGWVNDGEDGACSAHDVLADQLLLKVLESKLVRSRKKFLNKLFETAVRFQAVASLLVSLERIGDRDTLLECQPQQRIRAWAERHPQALSPCRGKLLGTTLLDYEEKMAWLKEPDFWRDAAQDPDFRSGLLELGLVARKQGGGEALAGWIKEALEVEPGSTRLLQLGLQLAPQDFRQQALTFLGENKGSTACFVMMGWLEARLDPEEISLYLEAWCKRFSTSLFFCLLARRWLDARPDALPKLASHCRNWLKRHGHHPNARYLLTAWLGAGGDLEVVKPYVIAWLEKFPLEMETQFVIKAWLDRGGGREVVAALISPWLEKFPLEMETSFVIQPWLDSGGDREVVAALISPWLEKFPLEIDARFVISAWLNSGGEREVVAALISPWLEKFPLEMETSFVIKAWLKSGGSLKVAEPFMSPWLEKFPLEMETHFVIKTWLTSGGEQDIVKPYVHPWLEKFPRQMESSFVIQSWLDSGGDREVIATWVAPWLEKFPLEMETSFVIKAWLNSGGDCEVVAAWVAPWLEKFHLEMETSFVIQSWLDSGGDREVVAGWVAPWLEKFSLEMETSFVIKAWLNSGGDREVVAGWVAPWLEKFPLEMETSFVIQPWLDSGGDGDVVAGWVAPWLEKFPLEMETSFVIQAWLDSGGDLNLVSSFLEPWLQRFSGAENADFLIRAWLEAGGAFEAVQKEAMAWLAEHWRKADAVYITKVLAKQRDLPSQAVMHILGWCSLHAHDPDALWRFTQLKQKPYFEDTAKAALFAFEAIFRKLPSSSLKPVTHGLIVAALHNLVSASTMQYQDRAARVNRMLLSYVCRPDSFPKTMKAWPYMQNKFLLERLSQMLLSQELSPQADQAPLTRFFQWMAHGWYPENVEKVRPQIQCLNRSFPNNGFIPDQLISSQQA